MERFGFISCVGCAGGATVLPMIRSILRWLPVRWRMKLAWEGRARRNAMHYVADFRPDWEGREEEFFQTGLDDTEAILRRAVWGDTSGASLLEIGCGVGRMTRHLAGRFAHVTGVDISASMIADARRHLAGLPNVALHVTNGEDLHALPDASFDFALSYIVFQHVPEPGVVLGYVRDVCRVLKPVGRFLFQARNDPEHAGCGTYTGAAVSVDDVRRTAEAAGRRLLRVEGAGTQYCFFEVG